MLPDTQFETKIIHAFIREYLQWVFEFSETTRIDIASSNKYRTDCTFVVCNSPRERLTMNFRWIYRTHLVREIPDTRSLYARNNIPPGTDRRMWLWDTPARNYLLCCSTCTHTNATLANLLAVYSHTFVYILANIGRNVPNE